MYCCVQYFVFVIVIFVLETIASVLAFVYRIEIENTVKQQLLFVIKEKWSEDDEEGWREGWAYTQHNVCCSFVVVVLTVVVLLWL